MKTDPRPMALDVTRLGPYRDLFAYREGLLSAETIRARQEAALPARPTQAGTVAVIGLHGVILRRPSMFDELFGAASLEGFMAAVRASVADPEVSAIVLDIDSPGGEVDGLNEAATELRGLRDRKRIVAIADTMAASAAYWIASQASELSVSPSGGVGAIGIYTVYDDISAMLDKEGIKRTVISAGKFKEASVAGLPLSDEARKQFQDLADSHYASFTSDVAKGRSVPVGTVRNGYGEGLFLGAFAAKEAGMVDRIATLGDVLRSPALRTTRLAAAVMGTGNTVDIGPAVDWEWGAGLLLSDPNPESAPGPVIDNETPPPIEPTDPEPIPEPEPPEIPEPQAGLDWYRYRARRHQRAS